MKEESRLEADTELKKRRNNKAHTLYNMARAKKIKKHQIIPDPLYDDITVAKFINHIMKGGKKTIARKVVYGAFDIIKEQAKAEPLEIFEKAMANIAPRVEVRPRRVGGATYQVPIEVRGDRKLTLAMRWIIGAAKSKKGKSMKEKLAEEILAASKNSGEAIRKKENLRRLAEANRAFAHLAW